ncbi:resolvase, partial [Salmonella enterica]|nr:resolvase [Salmonella enterica]
GTGCSFRCRVLMLWPCSKEFLSPPGLTC